MIDLLLVEDNPGDVRFAQEALKDYKMQNALHVVTDGDEALTYLRGEAPYTARTLPDMILLDMNLPKVDGSEVLAEMAKDPVLKAIPVVILTSSKLDQRMMELYKIHADCYIMKPLTLERYLEAVKCFPHLGISIIKIANA